MRNGGRFADILATTSGFSAPAAALAKQHNTWMLDGLELSKQIGYLTASKSAAATGSARQTRLLAALGLPIGLFLLVYVSQEADRVMPATPAVSTAVLAFTAPLSPPRAGPVVQPAPRPTTVVQALPTPTVQMVRVANTNGVGVYIRRTPSLEDKLRAYRDGTVLRMLGEDVDAGGVHWRHVGTPDGVEGYVPADYVAPNAGP